MHASERESLSRTGPCRCQERLRGAPRGRGPYVRDVRPKSGARASPCAPPSASGHAAQDLRGGAAGAWQLRRRLGRGERLRRGVRVRSASAAPLAEHLPAVARQRDVRPAAQPVQSAGVTQAPHPRPVLLRPTRVAVTAVEQHSGAHGVRRRRSCGITRRSWASSVFRNIQPSAGAGRRVNEALARSRSSGSRTATIAVAGLGRCRECSPLTTSRGLRSSGMPASAHSAGSSRRARGVADAADKSADDVDAAEDGANPKVTVLPSATRPYGGRGRIRGSAHRNSALPVNGGEPCGERTSILPVELGCGNEQLGPPTRI